MLLLFNFLQQQGCQTVGKKHIAFAVVIVALAAAVTDVVLVACLSISICLLSFFSVLTRLLKNRIIIDIEICPKIQMSYDNLYSKFES